MRVVAVCNDMRLSFECDRFVVGPDTKMGMISFVANASVAKAVIAMIQSGKRIASFDRDDDTSNFNSHVYLSPIPYRVAKERLPNFNAYHVVAIINRPSIVIGDVQEGIEARLFSEHITTPMLPAWVPYVSERLKLIGSIRELRAYNTKAYDLIFNDEDVDRIVADGLKKGKLLIPSKKANHANPRNVGRRLPATV